MAAAVLTPRVRLMAICDGVRESKTEAGVFNVKGLRQRMVVDGFPFVASRLWLFLVLSSHHTGQYPGYKRRYITWNTKGRRSFASPHSRYSRRYR